MGNAPSTGHRPVQGAAGSETVKSPIENSLDGGSRRGSTSGDVNSAQQDSSESEKQRPDQAETDGDATVESSSIRSGTFSHSLISIQTLGSGGPAEYGTIHNIDPTNLAVGQTLGAALGGISVGGNIASGDALLSCLPKDLGPSALGGQLVAIGRLWPGSGRMMRSYRIRVRVPRIDSKTNALEPENNSTNVAAASLSCTIELACKAFIVRSEEGEAPLLKKLTEGDAELKRLRSLLSDAADHPHVLPYVRWAVGHSSAPNSPIPTTTPVARPIYLLRQHAHASLSDRLVSRPFLTLIEKNWIAYQLLKAVQSLHDAGVCHGHLTTENVLLTSWNWVLISDVGCQHYKPVTLPGDDPGEWIHWFEGRGGDTVRRESLGGHHRGNGEKKCCLAPERFRFMKDSHNKERGGGDEVAAVTPTNLTPAMDVFSLGCVLIELFLNGEHALDLGDLMEYRRQGGDGVTLPQSLKQKLDKIESSKMRAACRHMLSLDPSSRLSPVEYLERLSSNSTKKKTGDAISDESTGKKSTQQPSTLAPMPPCFKSALYPFMHRLRTQIFSPDARIALVACHYGDVLKATVGVDDEWGTAYFARMLGPAMRHLEKSFLDGAYKTGTLPTAKKKDHDLSSLTLDELLIESENFLRQLDSGAFASIEDRFVPNNAAMPKPFAEFDHIPKSHPSDLSWPSHSSIILLLQVVFSSVRHVQRTSSKFVALKLMHRIALFSSDDIRLQRIVPYVTLLLQDSEPIIRASGITVLSSVLSLVTTFPPSDAMIFPRYVFKKVAHLITDASLIVRVAFAQNISLLAETALRFLDVGHSVSLYEAVAGRHSMDGSSRDDKAKVSTAVFSEEAANLLGKKEDSPNSTAPSARVDSSDTENLAETITVKSSYDADLAVLHEVVMRWVIHITTDASDHSSQSKQALLCGLPRLCNFFGADYSFQILPILLAFLNDRQNWQLRAALCQHLPSVCVSVGRAATEQFVIPCIETALNDDVDQVVSEALRCLTTLVSLSLLTRISLLGTEIAGPLSLPNESHTRSRRKKQGIIRRCGPLLLHPSSVVRTNAALLILASWQVLGDTDAEVFVNHLLRPYLQYRPTFESLAELNQCLKAPTYQKNSTTPVKTLGIDFEIEISSKLANSLSVPSQKFVELLSKNSFKWYEPLHLAASKDPKLSAPIFSLGFASLQKVHGLNIEPPTTTSNRVLINQADEKKLSGLVGNKEDITDETIASFLTRPEVKAAESACHGEWGSAATVDQLVPENKVHSLITSLNVPPLSPNIGLARSGNNTGVLSRNWSPKEDGIVGSATEHSGPVHRLAVSEDQAFFVSASYDGTSKVFELRQARDSGGDLHSCLTYEGHKLGNEHTHVRINDVAILEHSHSVATGASDGSLHVWRVDMVTSHQNQQTKTSRVSGHSTLRNLNPGEGEVLAVSHFNTPSSSILVYATQRGYIHSLDIRCAREPFSLRLRPELGYLESGAMEVGHDKNWIVAGTSRGYLGLWDVRYQMMAKLWRHSRDSPIKRVSNAFSNSLDEASRPLVFMGCDNNEASLFDISTGGCLQCYRVLDSSLSYVDQSALPQDCLTVPYLDNVKIPGRSGKRLVPLDKALQMAGRRSANDASINALVGGISLQGPSYLMTGGTDHTIRYWDLNSASKSCCVSGTDRNQPPPSFEQIQVGGNSRLILCRQPSIPPISLVESSKLPFRNRPGVSKCDSRHLDSVLDLKLINSSSTMPLLLSASRDHTIKMWA
ncbi:hypothetical protein ACHAWF_013027 [Thalassiosira exigua]